MDAYCIFCRTGTEKALLRQLRETLPEAEVLLPLRLLQERRGGTWTEQERPLIPGYIFIFTKENIPSLPVGGLRNVYKILEYPDGERKLRGGDYAYALWLHRHNGVIGTSLAVSEGDSVRVTEGALADGVGKIRRLDRHKRRALVEFDFYGKKQTISLSVEDLSAPTEKEKPEAENPCKN